MCRVAVALGEELASYHFPPPHPFSAERYEAFRRALFSEAGLRVIQVRPRRASEEELALFHDPSYVEYVKLASRRGRGYLDQGDTPAFRGIYEAASYVVGSSLSLLDLILTGAADHGFNPIGGLHHARRAAAAGFCVFNDVGVVIEAARRRGLRDILYVDIDAHHGDGVFYEYEHDPHVWILDVHEDGRFLYPGTGFPHERGEGRAHGTKLNIPLSPGAGDEAFFQALERAREFLEGIRPDLVLMQAGADGLEGDPLTHLRYSFRVHERVASYLHRFSHERAGGRLLACGGGGYLPENVTKAWMAVLRGLAGLK